MTDEIDGIEMSYLEKPNLNELAYLAHYGIKGMRWGHHKIDAPGSGRDSGSAEKSTSERKSAAKENATTKEYMAIKDKPRTKEAAAKELAKNEQKFAAKANPSNAKEGLTDQQKALIKVGIGVAAIGGLLLYAKYSDNKNIAKMREMAGKRISASQFNEHVTASKMKTWGFEGYFQDSSFTRREFSLPAGHEFHRISTTGGEKGFSLGTYSVHSVEDLNRYVAGFRGEKAAKEFYHVTWKAKEEIKVPNLTTVLETMRETFPGMSKEEAKATYQQWSGGHWGGTKHTAFFEALKNKGYGAIVDEMDAGVIGETPLVFFGKDKVTEKASKLMTPEFIKKAEEAIVEITNRKL